MFDYDATYSQILAEQLKDIPPLVVTAKEWAEDPEIVKEQVAVLRKAVINAHKLTLLKLMEDCDETSDRGNKETKCKIDTIGRLTAQPSFEGFPFENTKLKISYTGNIGVWDLAHAIQYFPDLLRLAIDISNTNYTNDPSGLGQDTLMALTQTTARELVKGSGFICDIEHKEE